MNEVSAAVVKRWQDLVVTETDDEVLIYDQVSHHIHHLNAACSKVWKQCDGTADPAHIAKATGLPRDVVDLALHRLDDANLLEGGSRDQRMAPASSRRAFLRKTAIAGGLAFPAIISVSAPAAADGESCSDDSSSSGNPNDCACGNNHAYCASGYCGYLTWDATHKVCMPPPW